MSTRVREASDLGQSLWYDNIRRAMFASGELQDLITRDGIVGVTSNPSIFERAITTGNDYADAIRALVDARAGDAQTIYERLAIDDIRSAADLLRPVHVATGGRDGYVSLEVSPHLAHLTDETVAEARRLHTAVNRTNVMIKVPATTAGIVAVERLTGLGLSINVTLIFSVATYAAVADAYMRGLEHFAATGGNPGSVSSVASFFVSRIDVAVDGRLTAALATSTDPMRRATLERLLGRAAIANAKRAYRQFQALMASDRWARLAALGAKPQRLLWASTGTKDPRLSKSWYVDELIGAHTVNTVPDDTLRAFIADGHVRPSLAAGHDQADADLRALDAAGVSLADVTDTLQRQGVAAFAAAFDRLMGAIERTRQTLLGPALAQQTISAGAAAGAVQATLDDWRDSGRHRRLWLRDATVWTGDDEAQWLDWLDAPQIAAATLASLAALARDGKAFRHVVLLGMGGSSLGPWVLKETFGTRPGHPDLHILDSVDPAQVLAVEQAIDVARTLFIVASKSGGTAEPNALYAHFATRLRAEGVTEPGAHFIAITDPGTSLEALAARDHFRHIVFGLPKVGGRFSALTAFGLVPAALMGLDPADLLGRTQLMVHACAAAVPPQDNPGVALGITLGVLARAGRNKLTILADPPLHALGAWLEQLIAESTGKLGLGIVPVDDEPLGAPGAYGADRVFVHLRTSEAPAGATAPNARDAAVTSFEQAGHPVIRITLGDALDIGQEFFRWEMATAVAGAVLGLNAFNQPDVEAAKIATRTFMSAYDAGGTPASTPPQAEDAFLRCHVGQTAGRPTLAGDTAEALLAGHLANLSAGDYFAINAFLPMFDDHHQELQAIRTLVRDHTGVATTLGYGPRFLHSTGQLHKGGPNSGVFLVLLADDATDLSVPGTRYTFGAMKRAQALGDCQVLEERGRRVLRVELGPDVGASLRHLHTLITRALGAHA